LLKSHSGQIPDYIYDQTYDNYDQDDYTPYMNADTILDAVQHNDFMSLNKLVRAGYKSNLADGIILFNHNNSDERKVFKQK